MTPHLLDEVAERMFAPAVRLVSAVHDYDRVTAHEVLAGLGVIELRALAVNLASLVPDDEALGTLLTWSRSVAPISDRQATAHREQLEAEVVAYSRSKRGAA